MYRYIKSAGYHGYSMSNNAVAAYEDGEMPLSKWTKTAILSELAELDYSQEIQDIAKKLTVAQLKDIFLFKSSWHHTSKMYNKTDFYSVSPDITMDMINDVIANSPAKPNVKEPQYTYAYVEWGEWEGSRSRPKLVEYSGCAIIKEPWAYVVEDQYSSVKKKKTSGSHFNIVSEYDHIPNADAATFNKIKSYIEGKV